MSLADLPLLRGLSSTADGREVPTARERATARTARLDDRVVGWLGPVAVTLMAFGMRLWHLGTPHGFSFDETYYAKDAWSMANFGYVRNYQQNVAGLKIDDAILAGHTQGIWADGPSMIVHPEVGKWLIALGEKSFGMDPFGWRIASCVVGSLMILVLCRLARRLTGSTLLGCVAGLLLAFDGMQYVLSRLALLDIFLAFFLLCGVACVVNDRDWMRARLARRHEPGRWGGLLLWRPWLLLGGISFGLACGTKWDAVYPLAGFGVMVWVWSAGARRSIGVGASLLRSAVVDGVPAFLQLVVVAGVVYVLSWTGWLIHAGEYDEHLSSTQYTQFVHENPCKDGQTDNTTDASRRWATADDADAHGVARVVDALRSLASYHHDVYVFHTHYLNCSTHVYASKPSGWLVLNRPVGVATDLTVQPGDSGCDAPTGDVCYREVLLLGTPVLWWGGCVALLVAMGGWVLRRDWRWGVAVLGTLTTWLPWLQYDNRPIFSYYAIATLPFLVLAIVMAMGSLIGSSRLPSHRRTVGVVVGGSFFVLVLLNFAYFFPIYSYEVLPRTAWLQRMWFSRWI